MVDGLMEIFMWTVMAMAKEDVVWRGGKLSEFKADG